MKIAGEEWEKISLVSEFTSKFNTDLGANKNLFNVTLSSGTNEFKITASSSLAQFSLISGHKNNKKYVLIKLPPKSINVTFNGKKWTNDFEDLFYLDISTHNVFVPQSFATLFDPSVFENKSIDDVDINLIKTSRIHPSETTKIAVSSDPNYLIKNREQNFVTFYWGLFDGATALQTNLYTQTIYLSYDPNEGQEFSSKQFWDAVSNTAKAKNVDTNKIISDCFDSVALKSGATYANMVQGGLSYERLLMSTLGEQFINVSKSNKLYYSRITETFSETTSLFKEKVQSLNTNPIHEFLIDIKAKDVQFRLITKGSKKYIHIFLPKNSIETSYNGGPITKNNFEDLFYIDVSDWAIN